MVEGRVKGEVPCRLRDTSFLGILSVYNKSLRRRHSCVGDGPKGGWVKMLASYLRIAVRAWGPRCRGVMGYQQYRGLRKLGLGNSEKIDVSPERNHHRTQVPWV